MSDMNPKGRQLYRRSVFAIIRSSKMREEFWLKYGGNTTVLGTILNNSTIEEQFPNVGRVTQAF